jgi:hypothetical protein
MIRVAIFLILLAAVSGSASAQSGTSAAFGGNIPTFGASAGTEILRHRGPTGNPCLDVGGFARPHTVNKKLYDHVITAQNNCAQSITMQICYYGSQDCLSMDIPGGERKEAILGTLPSIRDFRFEFREKFER